MYFPIGAPSVYSQDLPSNPRNANYVLQDGLDIRRDNGTGELIPGLGNESDTPSTTSASNTQQSSPSIDGLQQDGSQPGSGNAPSASFHGLVGMQSARNGQIFATITADSITVWQVKVW